MSIGLGAVLLFLTVAAIGGALTTNKVANTARESTLLSDAYQQARYSVGEEESLERKYRLEPGPDVRARYSQANASFAAALGEVRQHGSQKDRALTDQLLRRQASYLRAIREMFRAVDAGQARRVLAIDAGQVDPSFGVIEEQVNAAAARHRDDALSQLRTLHRSERLVLIATLAAFGFGIVLLFALTAILIAYRSRADRTRQAELGRLERVAITDSLTDLRNHRAFEEDLDREVARRNRSGGDLALVMLDMEHLKQVNDTQGHQAGDERLEALADDLRGTARESDSVYRIGGDEFAVILVGERAWGGFEFLQRLQATLAARGDGLTVAGGVAEATGETTRDELTKQVDLALLEAKHTQRGAVIYSDDLKPNVVSLDGADQHHVKTLATALARAVDAKDSYTRSHCETVSETCALIAQELGFGRRRIARIRIAGLLHDVGKIGISDAILQKPDKLTDEEFEIMKTHTTLGHRIVMGAELEEQAGWILHHHERPDGRGYPDGLSGEDVPIESLIILVSDAFEAITSDRPYRKGRPIADALAELERYSGTQFDPDCVKALKTCLARGVVESLQDAPPLVAATA